MPEEKTFEIEIDSAQPERDAHDFAERCTASDADVRRHLSDESIHKLRTLTTRKIQLQLTVPAVFSIAHTLISWLKAKPSDTQATVHVDSGVYQLRSGDDGDTEQFLTFLRSSMEASQVSNPPGAGRL